MKNERQQQWTKRYGELLKDFTAALGGDNITPTNKATAKVLATLQCELSLLSDRFAGDGRGASAEDLSLFLKLTEKIGDLLDHVGLAPKQQPPAPQGNLLDSPIIATLQRVIVGKIEVREELQAQRDAEEAEGIFRLPVELNGWNFELGPIITDPEHIKYEQQIYLLRQQIKALERQRDGETPVPNLLPAPPVTPPAPNVTAEPEPPPIVPPPPNIVPIREKTSTERFYEWSAEQTPRFP